MTYIREATSRSRPSKTRSAITNKRLQMDLFEVEVRIFTSANFMFPIREPMLTQKSTLIRMLTRRDLNHSSVSYESTGAYYRMSGSRIDISTSLADMGAIAAGRAIAKNKH
jgi:hypothetical protein